MLLGSLVTSLARAATLQVGPSQTYESIQDALADATSGDRIEVDAGTYTERALEIGVDVTIVGVGGSAATTWTTSGTGVLARVNAGATVEIDGFAFAPAEGVPAVLVQGTLTGDDWLVSASTESAVAVDGGALTLSASTLDGNTATTGGAHVIVLGGSAHLTDCTLGGGSAPLGGAIYAEGGDITLDGVRLEGNHADDSGGAVYVVDGTLTADASLFLTNDATVDWGGGTGGAVMLAGTSAGAFDACEFTDNSAGESGGAIEVLDASGLTVTGGTFSGNDSPYGGALYLSTTADATVSAAEFTGNAATAGNGGAIRLRTLEDATLSIDTTLFVDNTASSYGGAIATTSESGAELGGIVLDGDWFAGNSAANGGAMSLANLATIDAAHLVLCANTSDGEGGAARVSASGSVKHEWTNSVFTDNAAGGAGGALWLSDASGAILNDTFLGNDAPLLSGGALSLQGNTDAEVVNVLIAYTTGGNGIATDLFGGSLALDYSLFFDNAADDVPLFTGGTGNVYGEDPLLVAYSGDADCTNDQPWPNAGSPLVDAGDPAFADPDGSRSDIGAYGGPQADWTEFEDLDGDGFLAAVDCDDGDPYVFPGAEEICNEVDDDCDGAIDVGAADGVPFFADGDDDGYGVDTDPVTGCTAPPGYAAQGGDCDDARADVSPVATEVCDGVDDDCDGAVDEDVIPTWYVDADGDGWGTGEGSAACTPLPDEVDRSGDCDDANAGVNPDAADEPGDGLDTNCDGQDGVVDVPGGAESKSEDLIAGGGGCGCDQRGAGGSALGALLALGLLRRRR